jgi:hypothetical protein
MLNRDDFSFIFSDDVELMDARYAEPFIYKYYHFPDLVLQREFFAKPTIKLTHKDDLNDPFELSRRWSKFGCPFTKPVFDKYVRKRFERQFSDVNFLREKLQARAKESGRALSRQKIVLTINQFLYLVDVPRGMIKSVIFGYNFPVTLIDECAASLLGFEGDIEVKRARFDPDSRLVTHA